MSKNWLTKATTTVKNAAGRTGLKIQKNSPEILLGIGIVTFVGTVVLACKGTLAAQDILKEHKDMLDDIDEAKQIAEESQKAAEETGDDTNMVLYDEELVKADKIRTYVKTGIRMAKAYGPAVAMGIISVTSIVTSRNILNKRYLQAVSAYTGIREVFDQYRKRVIDEQGEMMDRHFRYGTELTAQNILDENGKKTKQTETVENFDKDKKTPSDTAVYFDESNPNWDPNPNYTKMFLRAQQNMATDILRSRGHIFLNEVYDMLGFAHTSEGALVGWIRGAGDDEVDFGLFDAENSNSRAFINGQKNVFLLDFNHDGVIYNKI